MGGPRCKWTDADDATLVAKLRYAKENGFQSESGWKPQTWALCVAALADSPGPTKTAEKILDHWGNLKSTFVTVQTLCTQSGFGWDDGLNMVTATEDVWTAYLAKHPNAKRWKKTPFPSTMRFFSWWMVSWPLARPESQSQASETPIRTSPGAPDTSFDIPMTSGDDDLTLSSPIRPRCKCAASSSPADVGKRPWKRNAEAASKMANALLQVASSLNVVDSPEVRQRAIKLMEEDGEFSDNEEVHVMRLFTKDTAVAQTFIGASKKVGVQLLSVLSLKTASFEF